MAKKKWDSYSACACVEGFDGEEHSEEEQLSAWKYLYDSGVCWSLQGWYGRTVVSLLEQGLLKKKACVEYKKKGA